MRSGVSSSLSVRNRPVITPRSYRKLRRIRHCWQLIALACYAPDMNGRRPLGSECVSAPAMRVDRIRSVFSHRTTRFPVNSIGAMFSPAIQEQRHTWSRYGKMDAPGVTHRAYEGDD